MKKLAILYRREDECNLGSSNRTNFADPIFLIAYIILFEIIFVCIVPKETLVVIPVHTNRTNDQQQT